MVFYLPWPLLIEPYWNWNHARRYIAICAPSSFNRTILELKSWCRDIQGWTCRLLIEPYWNWNLLHDKKKNIKSCLLIEPYWNWNQNLREVWTYNKRLLIEPYWNWNFIFRAMRFNNFKLLIEPYWNWNGSDLGIQVQW